MTVVLSSGSALRPALDGQRADVRLPQCAGEPGEVQQLLPGPERLHYGPVSSDQNLSIMVQ